MTNTPDTFHVPKDFQSRPEFRHLEAEAGFHLATAVFLVLWRELAYLAEIQRLGFIRSEQARRVIEREFKRDDGNAFEKDPIPALVRATVLIECEDGYECRSFAAYNRHLSHDFISTAGKGAYFTALKAKRAHFEKEAREQISGLDRAQFVRPNAEPMGEDEIRRVLMMVKLIDNVYGRPLRTPREYSAGLINDAYRAVTQHSTDLINGVCFILVNKRKRVDPGIPMRTEEALREFDQLVKQFGRTGLAQKKRKETLNAQKENRAAG